MLRNPNPLGWKSSALVALLFCCSLPSQANSTCPGDTIIVDGKQVVVERRVTASDTDQPQDEGTGRRRIIRRYIGGVGGGIGATLASQSSQTAGFETIDEFIGRPTSARVAFQAGLTFGYESGEKWLFETGLFLGYTSVGNRYFVGSALGDSLVAFESPEGGALKQIRRFRYEIGEEWYTDPVSLRKGSYSQLTADVPLQLMTRFPAPRGSKTLWLAGGGVRARFLMNATSTNWVLINADGGYQFLDLDDIAPRFFQLDVVLTGGVRLVMNQKSHLGIRGFISLPVVGPVTTTEPFDMRWVQAGLTVTVNKIFRHDQKRNTTN